MMTHEPRTDLDEVEIRISPDLVRRTFPGEAIALNLDTGMYYGFNNVADAMLSALEDAGSIPGASAVLAKRFDAPKAKIEEDLRAFCSQLLERGLVKLGPPHAARP
jgi:hypothetical protein